MDKASVKSAIYGHPEFSSFIAGMNAHFDVWRQRTAQMLRQLETGCHPKQVIASLSEDLLSHYTDKPLIDKYDIYQRLMDYWEDTMQDDCYVIAVEGWKAETYRLIETKQGKGGKPGKEVDRGWIHEHSRQLNHVPIIAPHSRRGTKKSSQMQKVFPDKPTPQLTWAQQERYKTRTMSERVNARLKDEFGASQIRVRGAAKVMAHLMFGVLALTVDQWLRMKAPR